MFIQREICGNKSIRIYTFPYRLSTKEEDDWSDIDKSPLCTSLPTEQDKFAVHSKLERFGKHLDLGNFDIGALTVFWEYADCMRIHRRNEDPEKWKSLEAFIETSFCLEVR